jgi:hypothetical protein
MATVTQQAARLGGAIETLTTQAAQLTAGLGLAVPMPPLQKDKAVRQIQLIEWAGATMAAANAVLSAQPTTPARKGQT